MGLFASKPPFDLAAFLSQKATPGARRKPAWNRPRNAAPAEVDAAGPTPEPTRSVAVED